jgi:hypothetical protein
MDMAAPPGMNDLREKTAFGVGEVDERNGCSRDRDVSEIGSESHGRDSTLRPARSSGDSVYSIHKLKSWEKSSGE